MAEQVLKDMNLSPQEMQMFSKAMRDPQFMQILNEYAQEISEPMNKEEAENYIKMVEEQSKGRGFSMKGKDLVIPTPDFCIKTCNKKMGSKFFINICHSDKVEPPQSNRRVDGSGVDWHIPYGLSRIHKDKDKGGADCTDVDYVVNKDVCKRCAESKRFKQFIAETAIESVERHYHLQLKREIKYPKLKYKGPTNTPKMLTIPSNVAPSASLDVSSEGADVGGKKPSTHVSPPPVHRDHLECVNGTNGKGNKNIEGVQEQEKASKEATNEDASQELLCEPKFDIVYRNGLDLGKFWMDNTIDSATESETPREILLRVFLPKVMNASEVELDVSDTQAILIVPGLYKLQVRWRYVVDSMKGSAKFDKAGHKLEVLLPTRAAITCPTSM